MPDLSAAQVVLGCVLTALTLAGIIAKRWGPKYRRAKAKAVAGWAQLFGTEEIRHKVTGKVLVEASPGVGVQVNDLKDAVTKLVDLHAQTEALQAAHHGHDRRITKVENDVEALQNNLVERIVGRAESAAAWRAMEAASNSTPDHVDEERTQ